MNTFFMQHQVLLAPMAGVSDKAFRTLCLEQGASLAYTEMISAKGLSYENEKTARLLQCDPKEKVIAVQLFGHEPEVMLREAVKITEYLGSKLAYLDINMGCPAHKIVRKGDGCALMLEPQLAQKIIRTLSHALEVPLTVKFRRGYALGEETAVSFARMAEEAGAAAVTVHGRYAEQLYCGKADWDVIASVKNVLSIPVIGNGDIVRGSDAYAMKKQTGCDAVMIARAARGNPWIFAEAQAALCGELLPPAPTVTQRISTARRHAEMLAAQEQGSLVRMRKHAMWYFSGIPGAATSRRKITTCVSLDDFNEVFDELLDLYESRKKSGNLS